jgi:hypothetical protein
MRSWFVFPLAIVSMSTLAAADPLILTVHTNPYQLKIIEIDNEPWLKMQYPAYLDIVNGFCPAIRSKYPNLKLSVAGSYGYDTGPGEGNISIPTGSGTQSSASGRIGTLKRCRWTMSGMPEECSSRATNITSTTPRKSVLMKGESVNFKK